MQKKRKVHRNFKIEARINARLIKYAKQTGRTQTRVLEIALAHYFLTS